MRISDFYSSIPKWYFLQKVFINTSRSFHLYVQRSSKEKMIVSTLNFNLLIIASSPRERMQSYVSSKKVKARTYVYQKFHNRKVLWKDASYLSLQFFSEVVLNKTGKGEWTIRLKGHTEWKTALSCFPNIVWINMLCHYC